VVSGAGWRSLLVALLVMAALWAAAIAVILLWAGVL
jgi:hypothetical protein